MSTLKPPPPHKKKKKIIKLKVNDFDCCPKSKTFVQLKLTNIVLDAKVLSQKLFDKAKNKTKTISKNNREKKKEESIEIEEVKRLGKLEKLDYHKFYRVYIETFYNFAIFKASTEQLQYCTTNVSVYAISNNYQNAALLITHSTVFKFFIVISVCIAVTLNLVCILTLQML